MTQYINKTSVEKILEELWQTDDGQKSEYRISYNKALQDVQTKLDTVEVKEMDIEKEARHYLLNEHISPLNEIFHQADLNAEVVYHRDIENAFKAGFKLGLRTKENN